jgi:hypothetical protein
MISQLLLAKRLFMEASEYAGRSDPVSSGIAISLLQDSAELLIWTLIKEKGITVKDDSSFLANLDRVQKDGYGIPQSAKLKELNKARVGFKHYGNLPAQSEASKFQGYVEEFLKDATSTHFGCDFEKLSLVDLIPFPDIRDRLKVAETHIATANLNAAVRETSIARVELFSKLERFAPQVDRALARESREFKYVTGYLERLREMSLVALLRLPLGDFAFLNATLIGATKTLDGKWYTTDTRGMLPSKDICERQLACLANIAIAIEAVI